MARRYALLLLCLGGVHAMRSRQRDEASTAPLHNWLAARPAAKGGALVVAGGVSGAIAKTATAPLERAKLISQAGASANFVTLMRDVVKAEGVKGLWRGNLANVVRVIPNKGILLMCADLYKSSVAAALPGCNGATVSSIAGSLAGLTSVLATYPLELVRTRMAFRICDEVSCAAYSTMSGTLANIVKADGLGGLYAGVSATLLGALPFEGIKFGVYDLCKGALPTGPDGRTAPLYSLVSGAVAGAVAHTLTYPMDTVRRRMQISGAVGATAAYSSMRQCVRVMLAEEGLGAFFYGLLPTVIRSVPNLGIQFLVYELLKSAVLGL